MEDSSNVLIANHQRKPGNLIEKSRFAMKTYLFKNVHVQTLINRWQ